MSLVRVFLPVLASLVATIPVSSTAQKPERARIGLLSLHDPAIEKTGNIGASAFRAGMQALGYVEGRNFELHERHADGEPARLVALAHELVAEQVEVIVAFGTDATRDARHATGSAATSGSTSATSAGPALSAARCLGHQIGGPMS